jgi:secreted trypsin-like serine protease
MSRHGGSPALLGRSRTIGAIAALLLVVGGMVVAPRADARPSGRIANGTAVTEERRAAMWPFLVALVFAGEDAYEGQTCGGTLIHPRLVLTAAHCVEDLDGGVLKRQAPGSIEVVAGAADLASVGGAQRVRATDVFVHPRWNAALSRSDIAVLRLARPVRLGAGVALGSVVTPQQDAWWGAGGGLAAAPQVGAWVAGWGNQRPWKGEEYPTALHEVLIPIASDAACSSTRDPGMGDFEGGYASSVDICGGVPDSDPDPDNGSTGLDSCSGDSGGPLVVGDGAGAWAVAGIVSYGGDCAATNYTAYTRVAAFRSWIQRARAVAAAPTLGPGRVGPVRALRVAKRDRSSVTLSWRPPASGAAGYTVFLEDRDGMLVRPTTAKRATAVVGGLRRGSRYRFWVGARARSGGDLAPLRAVSGRTAS